MERPLPLRNTIKTTPAAGDTEGREVDRHAQHANDRSPGDASNWATKPHVQE